VPKDHCPKGSLLLRHTHLRGEFSYSVGLRISGCVEVVSGKTADERSDLRVKRDSLLDFGGDDALHPRHSLKGVLQDFSWEEDSIHLRASLLKHRELRLSSHDSFLKQTLEHALHMLSDPAEFLHECRVCHRAGTIPIAVTIAVEPVVHRLFLAVKLRKAQRFKLITTQIIEVIVEEKVFRCVPALRGFMVGVSGNIELKQLG
jgi:hypothetical protein